MLRRPVLRHSVYRLPSADAPPASRALRRAASFLLFLSILAPAASAKTVVCIDARNEGFCTSAEGYYRAKYPDPPNKVSVTSDLQGCLGQLVDGDELIIVAHGENIANNFGGVFSFGGTTYTGFGGGSGVPVGEPPAHGFPLPPTFLGRKNLKIKLVMCWSGFDPDAEGPRKSSVKSLSDAFPGNSGVTVTGYNGTAGFPLDPELSNGTADQRTKARDELRRRTDWADNPPESHPGATTTQKSAAQAIVTEMFPGITVKRINYLDPVEGQPPHQGPYLTTLSDSECGDFFVPEDVSGPVPALGPLTVAALLALAGLGVATLQRRSASGPTAG